MMDLDLFTLPLCNPPHPIPPLLEPIIQVCRLCTALALSLFLLPPLFLSLLFLSIFSFFLFLPITCILVPIFALSWVFLGHRSWSKAASPMESACKIEVDADVVVKEEGRSSSSPEAECVEIDQSEVPPPLDGSSEDEVAVLEDGDGVDHDDGEFWKGVRRRYRRFKFNPFQSGTDKNSSFYELLSFWMRIETELEQIED